MRRRAGTQGLALITAVFVGPHPGLAQTGPPMERLTQAAAKAPPRAPTAAASGEKDKVTKINQWTVGLAAGLPEGTILRFATEIARNLNDGEELRILPIITPGAASNITDLLYLKDMDIAIVHADVFQHFRTAD